jgi:hypothetical protein
MRSRSGADGCSRGWRVSGEAIPGRVGGCHALRLPMRTRVRAHARPRRRCAVQSLRVVRPGAGYARRRRHFRRDSVRRRSGAVHDEAAQEAPAAEVEAVLASAVQVPYPLATPHTQWVPRLKRPPLFMGNSHVEDPRADTRRRTRCVARRRNRRGTGPRRSPPARKSSGSPSVRRQSSLSPMA